MSNCVSPRLLPLTIEKKHKCFFGFEKKRPSGNDLNSSFNLMKLPITQQHIDEAIEKIRQRKMHLQIQETVLELKQKPINHRKLFRKYVARESSIDKMMDYAIWKDKD